MGNKISWNNEKDEQLLLLRNAGKSFDEISRIIGSTKYAMKSRYYKLPRWRRDFSTVGTKGCPQGAILNPPSEELQLKSLISAVLNSPVKANKHIIMNADGTAKISIECVSDTEELS